MGINTLGTIDGRKQLIEEIKGWENVSRKKESYKQAQVYNGHSRSYIIDYLRTQFSENTVNKMPIISTVNLCKRIVNKQSSIYVTPPTRSFKGLTDEQSEKVIEWYKKNKVDSYFLKANRNFKNQEQTFLMLAPVNGKLKIRCLRPHHLDAIPSDADPEVADGYMINAFDKQLAQATGITNQQIADQDDYKAQLEKYVTWTNKQNFIFNGKGEITSEVLENPIGALPIIDISILKDFSFFVEFCNSIADFNIQFLAGLSDLAQVVKMQGWSVGWLKATENVMPEMVYVGPNMILKLKVDPNTNHEPSFGYSSPNADIDGSIRFVESILATFLSSMGLDDSTVTTQLGSTKFSSGIERLLAMIDQFEASKEDFDLFENVESKFFDLFRRWNNAYFGTSEKILDFAIPESATIEVKYHAPVMALTETEKIDGIIKKKEAGLLSRVEAIAQDRGVSIEQAEYIAEEIDRQDGLTKETEEEDTEPEEKDDSTYLE